MDGCGTLCGRFWSRFQQIFEGFWRVFRNFQVAKTPGLKSSQHSLRFARIRKKCQEPLRICKESAKNPPVNDCTHTPSRYTRPIIPTKSQIARLQNGGAAVNGLWPPAIESARGLWPTSVFRCDVGCLSVLPLLHSSFALLFLHSSFALTLFGTLSLVFLGFLQLGYLF